MSPRGQTTEKSQQFPLYNHKFLVRFIFPHTFLCLLPIYSLTFLSKDAGYVPLILCPISILYIFFLPTCYQVIKVFLLKTMYHCIHRYLFQQPTSLIHLNITYTYSVLPANSLSTAKIPYFNSLNS